MERRTLGRTGLGVSLLSLGTGGPSRFGQAWGATQAEASRLAARAIELGINFFDTAAGYSDSEVMLGHALSGVPRDRFTVATKYSYRHRSGELLSPREVREAVDKSLLRLQLEVLDIQQVHSLKPDDVDQVLDSQITELERVRDAGKIRFIGVTESPYADPTHEALQRAIASGRIDTVMVRCNLLAQSAERYVYPVAVAANVGVIAMIPVRRVLADPAKIRETVSGLKARELIAADVLPDDEPLGWLLRDGVNSYPEAAYRFAIEHSAVDTVLTGTGNLAHLEANVAAVEAGPLPGADLLRLRATFGHLDELLGD